jgi:GDP-4-dehydro-6-deoxy-D-mannose reductase
MGKVLVTGAGGFIGKALLNKISLDHEVITLDRSKGDITNYNTFLNLEKVDYVFHLAARTFVPDSWIETSDFLNTNVIGTTNVLEYCKRLNVPLTFVSAYVYGQPDSLPITEEAPIKPNNPYALSKYLAEQVCHFYATYHKLDITIIRPFNIYGPGQPNHFLIPKITDLVKKNLTIELFDLSPKRDYVFIDDVVDALVRTLELKLPGFNVFNIGSGRSISVKEVVDYIQTAAGSKLDVKSKEQYRKEELDNVFADISQSWLKLKWAPSTAFEDGIKKTLNG